MSKTVTIYVELPVSKSLYIIIGNIFLGSNPTLKINFLSTFFVCFSENPWEIFRKNFLHNRVYIYIKK